MDGVKLLDPQVVNAFREKYPDPKMAMLPPDKAKKFYETGRIDWNMGENREFLMFAIFLFRKNIFCLSWQE